MNDQYQADDIVRYNDGYVFEVAGVWGDLLWLKAEEPLVVNENECELVARLERDEDAEAH